MELPIAFRERMERLLGAEYEAFLHALMEESEVKGLRVNENKISAECFEANAPFLMEKIPYVKGGLRGFKGGGCGKASVSSCGGVLYAGSRCYGNRGGIASGADGTGGTTNS